MARNGKISPASRWPSVSHSTCASKTAHWPRTSSHRKKKQQRIHQILGIGAEYGTGAAPESLLPPKPEPN
jgi:hypothetical protein